MNSLHRLFSPAPYVAAVAGVFMMTGTASAQLASYYLAPNQPASFDGLNSLNGVMAAAPTFSNLPISFNIQGVVGQITFSGASSTAVGGSIHNANGSLFTDRYLAAAGGAVNIEFATQQRFLSMRWGSLDASNSLAFYNGNQLLQTITGSQAFAMRSGDVANGSFDAGFSFGEVGFTRVVASGVSTGAFEFGNLAFASTSPDVAPVPLGSVGGLIAFLAMMGARRRGLPWSEAMREANPFSKAPAARAA